MIQLFRTDSIELTSTFLNPSVFENSKMILIHDSIKSIDRDLFRKLKKINFFQIDAYYFRKLLHKHGIGWIHSINSKLNVNLSDTRDVKRYRKNVFQIVVKFFWSTLISDVFPDEDFCLYSNFPFHQLVVVSHHIWNYYTFKKSYNYNLTCTFRWLAQYYPILWNLVSGEVMIYMNVTMTAESEMPSKCDFDRFIAACKKHPFEARRILDLNDLKIGIKYIQVVLTISSYIISSFGIVTNTIFACIILNKKNEDLFKGLKQYPYLCAMSIFNCTILVIQIISWLSECKNIYDFFCPSTRRLVPIQFFKIIFKETLVIALRFMSNFAYFAFAFNRMALLGNDNVKFVKNITEMNFKKYMIVTGLISTSLSVVKGFKYQV